MKTYDPKTYELAEYLLKDYTVKGEYTARADCIRWIAQRVQKGVEDDIEDMLSAGHIEEKKK